MPTPLRDRRAYEEELKRLQLAMLRIQQSYFQQNRRGIVVLEGMDASGKGGAIRRMTETLDPRASRFGQSVPRAPRSRGDTICTAFGSACLSQARSRCSIAPGTAGS